jgi:hypothetical protein
MSPYDLLLPHGQPIGSPGKQRHVRVVPGGLTAAVALFAELAVDGQTIACPTYPGQKVALLGGGWIGLRPMSRSGEPCIDLDVPGVFFTKIKFV